VTTASPKNIFLCLTQRILGESNTDLRGLLFPWYQSELISSHRAALIISRVRLIAAAFALLSPTWIVLDIIFFPAAMCIKLAIGRLVASGAFAVLSLLYQKSDRMKDAYLALAMMFLIPTLFFWYSHFLFATIPLELTGLSASLVAGYAFLPFIMAVGLGVFPLTALEGLAFASPALMVELVSGAFGANLVSPDAHLGLIWLFFLVAMVAVLAGMSQLHYLSEIVIKSSHDPLTTAFNRAAGEELLEKYFLLAQRNDTPLSLVFVDLDNFKSINDSYGHEAGDAVLRSAATAIDDSIRREDLLIRWGGEEFLIVLPHAAGKDPTSMVARLAENGFGTRPDGKPVTASMGQAEFLSDKPDDLAKFVELADRRMYCAKRSGKNRICYGDETAEITPSGPFHQGPHSQGA